MWVVSLTDWPDSESTRDSWRYVSPLFLFVYFFCSLSAQPLRTNPRFFCQRVSPTTQVAITDRTVTMISTSMLCSRSYTWITLSRNLVFKNVLLTLARWIQTSHQNHCVKHFTWHAWTFKWCVETQLEQYKEWTSLLCTAENYAGKRVANGGELLPIAQALVAWVLSPTTHRSMVICCFTWAPRLPVKDFATIGSWFYLNLGANHSNSLVFFSSLKSCFKLRLLLRSLQINTATASQRNRSKGLMIYFDY